MITLAGNSFGFVWPLALAAIPIAFGCLIYLFRSKGNSRPEVVSSLFLLAKMPHYAPNRRRLTLPLQFWLELLLAILLALAASGLNSLKSGARIAVVVDTSKSMGALLSADETRLKAAIRIASADIAQANTDSVFKVFRAGHSLLEVRPTGSTSSILEKAEALKALKSLEPTFEADSLKEIVSDLLASKEYDSVWLYTDRAIQSQVMLDRLRVTTIPYDPDQVRNIWISSVELTESDNQKIRVGVLSVGADSSAKVRVSAVCTDRSSGESFNTPELEKRLISGGINNFELASIAKPWSYCRINLGEIDGDLLASDNEAWIVQSKERERLGIVTELAANDLGLAQLPFGEVLAFKSERELLQEGLKGIVYHRTQPSSAPHLPSMVIYPDVGAKLWGAGVSEGQVAKRASGEIEITRWDEAHPILRYARPGLLSLSSARSLECPVSATSVINSVTGSLLCAGEDHGQRYVIFGFEILPFDGIKSPTLSILTLNAFQWLLGANYSESVDLSTTRGLNEEVLRGDPNSYRVQLIAPSRESIDPRSYLLPLKPGVIAVSGAAEPRDSTLAERLIALNAISDQESDLMLNSPIDFASETIGEESPRRAGSLLSGSRSKFSEITDYGVTLAWLALATLVLDLIRRLISGAGWRERL